MTFVDYPDEPAILSTFDVTVYHEINFPPFFVERLQTTFRINKTLDPKSWSYKLPPSIDGNLADIVTL